MIMEKNSRSCIPSIILSLLLIFNFSFDASSESGYEAWLRYVPVEDPVTLREYQSISGSVFVFGNSEILNSALGELRYGIKGMTGSEPVTTGKLMAGNIIIGKITDIPGRIIMIPGDQLSKLTQEGYLIVRKGERIIITGKSDVGLLYGIFRLLRLMQMGESLADLNILENPRTRLRLLNHWDNPGKVPAGLPSVERGYAGETIFKWDELPQLNKRYTDYARMLASVGINGTVINNVNTAKNGLEGWKLLTPEYLPKLKALASEFREYGIKLFISVNFFSPVIISGSGDANPSDPEVRQWWINKVAEIYAEIPDFGGFLVKADSEGEPGPMKYGKTHADGANLIASALEPFGGLLIWRAFVYGNKDLSPDRASQAYEIFKPLDGHFAKNAIVQIKNGPIDFQVREPVSSLFGAMPSTNQMIELQITQEYTGHDKHVCYLVPQWKEILDFDTYARGPGSKVSRVADGSLFGYKYSGIAGVSNIGDDANWTGHLLAQANLYGFGRIAWDPDLGTEKITDEWVRLTFGKDIKVLSVVKELLLTSLKTYEDYTSPLGVGMMCNGGNTGHQGHFTPAPSSRVNYHKADKSGVGYDRTMATGSGFTGQFFEPVRSMYESLEKCPDELLLFFHHVPYSHRLKSGKTVIQHIYDSHNEGVEKVREYYDKWQTLEGLVDVERYKNVQERLKAQIGYAEEWRDSINSYFLNLSEYPETSVTH
jgi:alpha-glucuronidase